MCSWLFSRHSLQTRDLKKKFRPQNCLSQATNSAVFDQHPDARGGDASSATRPLRGQLLSSPSPRPLRFKLSTRIWRRRELLNPQEKEPCEFKMGKGTS